MNNLPQPSLMNEDLREAAVESVQKESAISGRKLDTISFIKEVGRKFIEMQLDNFPMLCDITRMQNKLKQDELRHQDSRGKYTDSLGWSANHTFKFDYEIPSELHLFMSNLVYKDFWAESNEKVWRCFMQKILRGDDSMDTLMWAKSQYGSNTQKLSVV